MAKEGHLDLVLIQLDEINLKNKNKMILKFTEYIPIIGPIARVIRKNPVVNMNTLYADAGAMLGLGVASGASGGLDGMLKGGQDAFVTLSKDANGILTGGSSIGNALSHLWNYGSYAAFHTPILPAVLGFSIPYVAGGVAGRFAKAGGGIEAAAIGTGEVVGGIYDPAHVSPDTAIIAGLDSALYFARKWVPAFKKNKTLNTVTKVGRGVAGVYMTAKAIGDLVSVFRQGDNSGSFIGPQHLIADGLAAYRYVQPAVKGALQKLPGIFHKKRH